MKLYEYEAKTLLAEHNVPTPKGKMVTSSQAADEAVAEWDEAVAVKAQVLIASRGKAGGIKFAQNPQEAKIVAQQLLGAEIKNEKVTKLLVEQKLAVKKELYLAVTVDRFNRCYVAVVSTAGGVDIEEFAEKQPQHVHKVPIDFQQGLRLTQAKQIAEKLGYTDEKQVIELAGILEKLYRTVMETDAELLEVNPLVETVEGKFAAADARIIIDDNALFRHPEFSRYRRDLSQQEAQLHKEGLESIKLNGNIGVIGNGAGLVMATLDILNLYGGEAANFLDIGGGASIKKVMVALKFLLADKDVKTVFVNILGGITRCDQIAQAIVETKENSNTIMAKKPLIVRLMGNNEERGKHILAQAGIYAYDSMEIAAQKAVEAAKRNRRIWAY